MADTSPPFEEQLAGRPDLTPGTRIGRYLALRPVGRGGMGIVVEAYDPELDRKVAIKLLRSALGHGSAGRERLLREARALARLAHPNVVAVYDVGTWEGSIYLAMELVGGTPFDAWLQHPRPTAEMLEVLRQAGEGLAAAHAAGLVHRDFKPSNVLVGDDGRTRVLDFGLVRGFAEASSRASPMRAPDSEGLGRTEELEQTDDAALSSTPSDFDSALTQPGSLVGTPGFTAPEMLDGEAVDARADQFAFGVTAYQALFGVHPFRGVNFPETLRNTAEARIVHPIPDDSAVPKVIQAAIGRALARSPEDRFGSMAELLAVLRPDESRRAFTWAWVVAAGLLVLGASWLAERWWTREERRCRAAGTEVTRTWNDDLRAEMRDRFASTGLPWSGAMAASIEGSLDAFADGWSHQRIDSCRATRVAGVQSERLLDLRTACLEERREQMVAVLEVLLSGSEETLAEGPEMAARLGGLDHCANGPALVATAPMPSEPEARRRLDDLRARTARARAFEWAGRGAESTELLDDTAVWGREFAHAPTEAEALLVLGRSLEKSDLERAEKALVEAELAAEEGGHDRLVAEARTRLVWVVGVLGGELERAEVWGRRAEAAIRRLDDPPDLVASLANHRAIFANIRGDLEASLEGFRRAVALRREAFGDHHPAVASSWMNVGLALDDLGRPEESAEVLREAIAVQESLRGPLHPIVLGARINLANVLRDSEKDDEAETELRTVLAISERDLSSRPVHAEVSHNLGVLLAAVGRNVEALPHFEVAERVFAEVLGSDNLKLALVADARALSLLDLGRLGEALESAQVAITISEGSDEPDPDVFASSLLTAGLIHAVEGRKARAATLLDRARAVEAREQSERRRAGLELSVAQGLVVAGRTDEARGLAEDCIQRARQSRDTEEEAEAQAWINATFGEG